MIGEFFFFSCSTLITNTNEYIIILDKKKNWIERKYKLFQRYKLFPWGLNRGPQLLFEIGVHVSWRFHYCNIAEYNEINKTEKKNKNKNKMVGTYSWKVHIVGGERWICWKGIVG